MQILWDKIDINTEAAILITLVSGVALIISGLALRSHFSVSHLAKSGQHAEATVLRANHCLSRDGKEVIANLVILVRPSSMRFFVSEVKCQLPFEKYDMFKAGASIVVKFNPYDKNQVMIDQTFYFC
ncbi:hypothetical protein MUK70_12710 [Dyadobacter chenwenxiniae]|uniref:DUF3592 domain-containing protein n=1 Tax=Dyadobacter chenwenxiniae TaxID=2906456 RepID=A0A9X1PHP8_9BACT|nr:hypothetical protein [Dyadobacter chenwenxiniae]MCF0060104.1 hypothetical protein [Dyadobacter chenwenxiniae]UON85842.1 hypothetical protein MUK70_12710 [Dyadobacter chenwenxiniae]